MANELVRSLQEKRYVAFCLDFPEPDSNATSEEQFVLSHVQDGYTEEEKPQIARRHLIPKQLAEKGIGAEQVTFTDEGLRCG